MADETKVPTSDAVKAAADDGATKEERAAIKQREENEALKDRINQKAEASRFATVKHDE